MDNLIDNIIGKHDGQYKGQRTTNRQPIEQPSKHSVDITYCRLTKYTVRPNRQLRREVDNQCDGHTVDISYKLLYILNNQERKVVHQLTYRLSIIFLSYQ